MASKKWNSFGTSEIAAPGLIHYFALALAEPNSCFPIASRTARVRSEKPAELEPRRGRRNSEFAVLRNGNSAAQPCSAWGRIVAGKGSDPLALHRLAQATRRSGRRFQRAGS